MPSGRDLAEPMLVNGGFEPPAGGTPASPSVGSKSTASQGQVFAGPGRQRHAEKHGGAASLRLDNANGGDIVQVSQNVTVGGDGLVAGKPYRLSAWLKTDHMAQPNAVGFGFLAAGMKSVGRGGRLPFPAAGAGWRKVAADFTVPAGAERLRIMIHVAGAARAWVDDMTLEEILPDGSARPAIFSGASPVSRFMQRWVALYHGEGRPWLQFGRMLHPPLLACATSTYQAASRGKGDTVVHTARHAARGPAQRVPRTGRQRGGRARQPDARRAARPPDVARQGAGTRRAPRRRHARQVGQLIGPWPSDTPRRCGWASSERTPTR